MEKLKLIVIVSFGLLLNTSFGQSKISIEKGDEAFNRKDYDRAISIYSEIVNTQSSENTYYAFYKRAYCFYELNELDKTKSDILNALKVNKKHEQYKFIKGNSYWLYYLVDRQDGMTKKSLKFLKKAARYYDSSLLYSTKGYAECFLGKYKKSLKSLTKAILLDPNNAWAYNNRALSYLKLNKTDLARMDVDQSIRMDEKNPYAYKNSALIYISKQDYDSACRDIKKAESLELSKRMTGNDLEDLLKLKQAYCESSK